MSASPSNQPFNIVVKMCSRCKNKYPKTKLKNIGGWYVCDGCDDDKDDEPKKTEPKKTEPKKTEPKKTVPKTTKVSCAGICGKKYEKTDMKTMDGLDGLVCDGCEHLYARPKKATERQMRKEAVAKDKKARAVKPNCGCDKGACKRKAHKDYEGLCAKCSQGNCDCKKGKGGCFKTQEERRTERAETLKKGLEALKKEHLPIETADDLEAYQKAVAELTQETNNPYKREGLKRVEPVKTKPLSKKAQEARAKRAYKMTNDDKEILEQNGFKMIEVENIHQRDGWGADEDTVRNGSIPSIKRVAYNTMAEAFTRMEQLKDKFARETLYNQETFDYGNPDEWTIYWGMDANTGSKGGGYEIRRHARCKNQPPSKTRFLSRVFVPLDIGDKFKMVNDSWNVKSSDEEEEPTTPTLPTTETIVEDGREIVDNPTLEWLAQEDEDEE